MTLPANAHTSQADKVVLSASRRTDLVACYPEYLVERLAQYPPDIVHTVVIWTKNPAPALQPGPLRETLARYRQLYIHLTVTGLGAGVLEPGIPPWRTVMDMLPGLLELAKSPERIAWRFDPLIRAETGGKIVTNSGMFAELAEEIRRYGITTCRTSWVEPYAKVLRRMEKCGCRLLPWSEQEKAEQARSLEKAASGLGMQLYYCSMPGFPRSACIDGKLLGRLHPESAHCSQRKAKGQRKQCGCTESIDIGWYSLKCKNGCLYCYAEPDTQKSRCLPD